MAVTAAGPEVEPGWDAERRIRLARARRRAGGLLLAVAVAFALSHLLTDGDGVWGYVQAACEAAVVGGVADWFAVTALFRHPLRIPIPHTAIIPKRKDAFGQTLGAFVANNFLDPDVLTERLAAAGPAGRIGAWLRLPRNAELAADRAAGLVAGAAAALSDAELAAGIREAVETRLRRVELAPFIGIVIDGAMEGGHHHALIDAALIGLGRSLAENQDLLRDLIKRESPWWIPEPVDERVFRRVYDGLQRFIAEVTADRDHELRAVFDDRARELAGRLATAPELRERADQIRDEFLAHPEFAEWADGLWLDIKDYLVAAADEPQSGLRLRLQRWVEALGERLETDGELQARVDAGILEFVRRALAQSGDEVTRAIAATVERWDATETSERLELFLGRDLQYIRINGTLVGGLIGVLLHTAAVAIG